MKKPILVVAVCWFLIVTKLFGLYQLIKTITDPIIMSIIKHNALINAYFELGISIFGTALVFICAIFMLKGRGWARLTYVIWTGINLAITYFAYNQNSPVFLSSVGIFSIFVIILYLPKSNIFFKSNKNEL